MAAQVLLSAGVGAVFGLIGSVIGNVINERLKADAANLEADLVRLIQFEDELLDVLDAPATLAERPTILRHLNVARRRLGTNIRTNVVASEAYSRCEIDLIRLNDFIQDAEDAKPLTDALEAEIHEVVRHLGRELRRTTPAARTYWFFRGK